DQHGQAARPDEERRDEAAPGVARHVAAGAGAARRLDDGVSLIAQISRREPALTSSVMTKSTRPISTSAFRYRRSAASVNSLAMTAAIVYCGANSDSDTFGLFPITIVTAIVSPSARPKPSMTAPMMPVRAENIAARMASKRVAPSA